MRVAPVRPRWIGMVLLGAALVVGAMVWRMKEQDKAALGRAAAAAARVRPELEAALRVKGLEFGTPVLVRAFKAERELDIYVLNAASGRFELFRTYPVAGQSGKLGPKLAEGDRQVPEGFYAVGRSGMKPDSAFHLAFNIGYPNAYDRHHGRTGSAIMVHGNTASSGCLAMTDPKIEEIYTLCDAALTRGQPFFRVHVFPFRMTADNLAQHADPRHDAFWRNLREGYEFFETRGEPPDVTVAGGVYQFREDETARRTQASSMPTGQ